MRLLLALFVCQDASKTGSNSAIIGCNLSKKFAISFLVTVAKHIKELVVENISLAKSTQKNKPEKLMSTLTQEQTVWLYQDTFVDENDMKSLPKLARNLHGDILQCKWKFSGNFLVILTILNLQHCWELLWNGCCWVHVQMNTFAGHQHIWYTIMWGHTTKAEITLRRIVKVFILRILWRLLMLVQKLIFTIQPEVRD